MATGAVRMATGVALVALWASSAIAAMISPGDARAHNGESATIEGVVAEVFTDRKSNTTFLDFGASYSNEVFSAVVFSGSQGSFGDLSPDTGKTVDVTGTIKLYRGRPEIVLTDSSQITVK